MIFGLSWCLHFQPRIIWAEESVPLSKDVSRDHIDEMISEQRRATVSLLEDLSTPDWDRPTLCAGWTVAHLAAHLSMPFRIGLPRLMIAMIRARGDFDRAADRLARHDVARMSPDALISALRENIHTEWNPLGGEPVDALCHDVIHGLDLSEGLDRSPTATLAQLACVLDTIKTKDRVEYFGGDLGGYTLAASELDFRIGAGQVISVPASTLVLILTGRMSVGDHLEHDTSEYS